MASLEAESSRRRQNAPAIQMISTPEQKDATKVTQLDIADLEEDSEQGTDMRGDYWGDTADDVRDMARLGKKQEFKRNFRLLSTLGFVSMYLQTWEYVLVSLSVGFYDGGFAGLFWCFITTVICYSSIVASLSEMESMAPTSGGQYSWISELAPPKYQRILSYASGWMSSLGWLAGVASTVYIVAVQIEAIINVTKPLFAFNNWQLTLIMLACLVVTILCNTWGARVLPEMEIVGLVGHITGFLVVIIPLWIMCDKNSAREVFLEFRNDSGYSSIGTAYVLSQVYVIYCNLGSDSIVHISEEVEDASIIVPRAMWWSYIGNVLVGIVVLITMLFCIGPLGPVVNSDVPYLLLFNRTGSTGVSIFLNIVLLVLIFVGNITAVATASRELFAFGRDRGLPFSSVIGRMNHKYNVPFNSVYATAIVVTAMCLIQLGSTLAFNIIVSLSVLGLLSTYTISIGCVLLKRLRGEPLPPARWSLGRYGVWINGFAFLYSIFIIVFCCFPSSLPETIASANWAPLVWVGIIVLSVIYYIVYGDKQYTAPVDFIEGRKAAGVGLQTST